MAKAKVKRKIAYVVTPIEFGGAEKVSLNFLGNVDRDQFKICPILFIRPWEKKNFLLQEIKKEKYRVHQVPVVKKPRDEGRDHFRIIRCFKIIFSILVKGHFDLIHTHGYFADIVGIPTAKVLGIPTISTCHGFIENDNRLKVYNTLDRIVLRLSDKIIAVSSEIAQNLLRHGIKESRIKVIPNAVKTDIDQNVFLENRQNSRQFYGFSEKDFVLGYVGRLSQEKGLKYLIDASSMIKKSRVPLKVLIVGEGPQKKDLANIVKKRRVESEVVFSGFKNNIDNLLPAMDVFVLPSLTEGTPMSLLEAMSYGIPVVASSVGGIPRIIDPGKTGILVAPGRPEELRDSVILLYNNPSLRSEIGKAGQRKVKEQFDIKRWARRIESEYTSLIANRVDRRSFI